MFAAHIRAAICEANSAAAGLTWVSADVDDRCAVDDDARVTSAISTVEQRSNTPDDEPSVSSGASVSGQKSSDSSDETNTLNVAHDEACAPSAANDDGQRLSNHDDEANALNFANDVQRMLCAAGDDEQAASDGSDVVHAASAAPFRFTVPNESKDGAESTPTSSVPNNGRRSWTRWTLSRLRKSIEDIFGVLVSKETIRRALHRLGMSWKKAKKVLAKANTTERVEFLEDMQELLMRLARGDDALLVYIDEAHIQQDADLGHGWGLRGKRLYVASSSPGLGAKVSFFGAYLYNEGLVRISPCDRANSETTMDMLQQLRDEFPERRIIVVWDGASYHRSRRVFARAQELGIELIRLPAYSPDFMPVESLWRWVRESITYNHCHHTAAELIERVAAFVAKINGNTFEVIDRLWVRTELDVEEEKMRFSR